jgi:DNA-binding Lrp family transcriptional regulator
MRVLWTLANNGRFATPGEIAERLGVTSSTATGLVERLVDGGYVERAHSTQDRRQVLLKLLPKGRRLMDGFRRQRPIAAPETHVPAGTRRRRAHDRRPRNPERHPGTNAMKRAILSCF